jgi:hypothetical protein
VRTAAVKATAGETSHPATTTERRRQDATLGMPTTVCTGLFGRPLSAQQRSRNSSSSISGSTDRWNSPARPEVTAPLVAFAQGSTCRRGPVQICTNSSMGGCLSPPRRARSELGFLCLPRRSPQDEAGCAFDGTTHRRRGAGRARQPGSTPPDQRCR